MKHLEVRWNPELHDSAREAAAIISRHEGRDTGAGGSAEARDCRNPEAKSGVFAKAQTGRCGSS